MLQTVAHPREIERERSPKQRFWDRNQKFRYLMLVETARRIVENPDLIEFARLYLDKSMAGVPSSRLYYKLWSELLDRPPPEIARRLLADTPEGERLRDSAPIFEVIEDGVRRQISHEATEWARRAGKS